MDHRGHRAEPAAEPRYHLGRQCDLGYQDNRAFPGGQCAAHGSHENFGFSAAGDTVKQELPAALFQCGQDLVQRFLLSGGQRVSRVCGGRHASAGSPQRFLVGQVDQPVLRQLFQRFARVLHRIGKFLYGSGFPVQQEPEKLSPFPAAPVGGDLLLRLFAAHAQAGRLFGLHVDPSAAHLRGQHQAQRLGQGAVALFRHFTGQFHQLRRDRGIVLQRPDHLAQLLRGHVGLTRQGGHDAFLFNVPERNGHALPGCELHAFRNQIGKRLRHVLMNNVHNHLTEHRFTLLPAHK